MIVVVNAARNSWQDGSYGLWVGGGSSFKQVYCSQVRVQPWAVVGPMGREARASGRALLHPPPPSCLRCRRLQAQWPACCVARSCSLLGACTFGP